MAQRIGANPLSHPLNPLPKSVDSSLDPLGVLTSTRQVVRRATRVRIDSAAIERLATGWATREAPAPEWDATLHWRGTAEQTANHLLALDALNFCFWGEPRWRVTF